VLEEDEVIVGASVEVIGVDDVILSELEAGPEAAIELEAVDVTAEEFDNVPEIDEVTVSELAAELILTIEVEFEMLDAETGALPEEFDEETPMKAELLVVFTETLLMTVEIAEGDTVALIELEVFWAPELIVGVAAEVLLRARLELVEVAGAGKLEMELELGEPPWAEGLGIVTAKDELFVFTNDEEEPVL